MITILSEWAKNVSLAVIVVSILEMLLPNNRTKKYIKITMGLYILFNIISPFIGNEVDLNLNSLIETSSEISEEQQITSENVNQASMNERLAQILEQELEKDVTDKLEEKGYTVLNCNVESTFSENGESKINSIKLEVEKDANKTQSADVESKLVEEIQKIKKVQIGEQQEKEETSLSIAERKEIQKFLCEEYGVSEKCLKIN